MNWPLPSFMQHTHPVLFSLKLHSRVTVFLKQLGLGAFMHVSKIFLIELSRSCSHTCQCLPATPVNLRRKCVKGEANNFIIKFSL
jgi:hypothetical protein